jgi:hypothetical protein
MIGARARRTPEDANPENLKNAKRLSASAHVYGGRLDDVRSGLMSIRYKYSTAPCVRLRVAQ